MMKSEGAEIMTACVPLTCFKEGDVTPLGDGLEHLQSRLMASANAGLEEEALELESLHLPVLFLTGSAEVVGRGAEHVQNLIHFLRNYPDYTVRLKGYADPRGNPDYNLQLSTARAQSVYKALEAGGIDPARVIIESFGAAHCAADASDMLACAHERRVDIELIEPRSTAA